MSNFDQEEAKIDAALSALYTKRKELEDRRWNLEDKPFLETVIGKCYKSIGNTDENDTGFSRVIKFHDTQNEIIVHEYRKLVTDETHWYVSTNSVRHFEKFKKPSDWYLEEITLDEFNKLVQDFKSEF